MRLISGVKCYKVGKKTMTFDLRLGVRCLLENTNMQLMRKTG